MISSQTNLYRGSSARIEPNHRQQLAIDRVEFAVGQLASALLSSCRSHELAGATIRDIRKAMGPIVADILADE